MDYYKVLTEYYNPGDFFDFLFSTGQLNQGHNGQIPRILSLLASLTLEN